MADSWSGAKKIMYKMNLEQERKEGIRNQVEEAPTSQKKMGPFEL